VQGTGFGIIGDLIIGIVGASAAGSCLNSASISAPALLQQSSTPQSARAHPVADHPACAWRNSAKIEMKY
jgi:hypothetical protein